MKKSMYAVVGGCLLGLSLSATAMDSKMMMTMDANGDGKITKDEYMSYHQKMWEGMSKSADGTMDAKMMMSMMQNGMMMKNDKAMSGEKK